MLIVGRSNDDWILRTYYSGNLSGGYRFSYYQRSRLRLGCNFLVVERSCLHKFKQFGVRVWLELFEDGGVANDMMLQPLFFSSDQLVQLSFIGHLLAFLLLEVADVVPEKIVRNYESFQAFSTLLSCIGDAV